MTIQIQTRVPELAARHGKHLAWLWRIVNATVIVVGIFCGYSLESRHQASAAVMQTVAGTVISPRGASTRSARGYGLHQAMQNLCIAAEAKPDQQPAHPKRVTLL